MPIASPPVCPLLIDREADLATLDRLLSEAAFGQGRLVLLTGEAGTGKSRLTREAAASATTRGFLLLTGYCTERDRDFPFAPFIDALRQHQMTTAPQHAPTVASEDELLALLLSETSGHDTHGGTSHLPPEQAKRRLFEAVGTYLARLANHQPLLVILEDLHWADSASLELLEMLPRRLAAARLLTLATARIDEPSADLHRLLAAQRRHRSVVELAVAPLDAAGVGRMLKALRATTPPSAVVAAIHARTDGNPFFIEELLATAPTRLEWLLGEAAVPATVQDTVLRRLRDIDPTAHDVANLAAVIGQRFGFALLLSASRLSQDKLLLALRALIERNLILADHTLAGQESFVFRHALTRDALLRRLLAPQRRDLHRIVAEALEQAATARHATGDDTRNLSYHCHAAGIWEKTLSYATEAGAAAERLHATVEALTHYRRALDAAIALDDLRTADLHHRCGVALARLGTFDEAKPHLEAALAVAQLRHQVTVEQAALYDLTGLYASRDYATARQLAEMTLARARSTGDRRREGLALNRLGNIVTNLLRFDEGRALHEEALAIFEAEHDRWGSADSLDLIGMARYLAGEIAEAREAFGRAAAIFADLGDAERVASALTTRGHYLAVLDGLCATSDPPGVYMADAMAGLRLCRDIAWGSGEANALVALSYADIGAGRYGTAQDHAEQALAMAEEMSHPQWIVKALLALGLLDVELGALGAASERFQRALTLAIGAGAVQWIERMEAWLTYCRVARGDNDFSDYGSAADDPTTWRPASIGQRRLVAARTLQALTAGQPDLALQWADLLLAGAAGPRPAEALLLRARALAALGRLAEADTGYLEARRTATDVGPRSVLWRAAAARSQLWQEQDPALAASERLIAQAELEVLSTSVTSAAHRTAFLETPEVRPWVASSGRRRPTGARELTARELEVARHVARGASNKEIARTLAIAEKTVEMHISNCLGKLSFASRTQLAAWVVTEGLLAAPPPQG